MELPLKAQALLLIVFLAVVSVINYLMQLQVHVALQGVSVV